MRVSRPPNTFHKPLTLAAFEAGAHVLCEKPMAMNAEEAREMLAASKAASKRLMINFSFRFTPQSLQLKKEVETGILGDIYYARTEWLRRRGLPGFGGWFGQKALSGGGALIDIGVHRLDLALWLMGYPKPTWVMASTCNAIASKLAKKSGSKFDVEDFATAMIKFENGATIDLAASWASNIKENELMQTRLLGTDGGLIQRNRGEGYDFEAEIYLERNGSQFDMQPHGKAPDATSAMAHFADCIINDVPHTATGEEGLLVMGFVKRVGGRDTRNIERLVLEHFLGVRIAFFDLEFVAEFFQEIRAQVGKRNDITFRVLGKLQRMPSAHSEPDNSYSKFGHDSVSFLSNLICCGSHTLP